ncbi:MAG TPA: beta-glucuronidase [Bacteroidetes bacterium]|nr:beta-glucuronidase [Bacteroidota bacterium]
MIRAFFVFISLICFSIVAHGQLITNIPNRTTTSLNGKWHYIIDPYETGYFDYRYRPYDTDENRKKSSAAFFNYAKAKNKLDRVEYDFDKSATLLVPGDWNSQDDKLLYYEGTIWYKKSFDYKKTGTGHPRVFVHFGAVNYIAEVYLNGEKLGTHEGGFTPFDFEVTDILKVENNCLVLKVDNTRFKEAVPTVNTDWWNYGGITRDVKLVEVPEVFIRDYFIQLKKGSDNIIAGFVQLNNAEKETEINISIPEIDFYKKIKTDNRGRAVFEFEINKLILWSPENPKLYKVIISSQYETLTDQIGFRTIESKNGKIILNGKPIFLRGICLHEENTMRGGRAYSDADALIALTWAKELNCNFMRLAHYPHNEHMIRMADKMGILLWEEIPVYWTVDFTNYQTYGKARSQLTEVITRDKNRASVIIWSMANETPQSDARYAFLKNLISLTRQMDDTRLVSAALQHRSEKGVNIIDDPISHEVDIVAFNQYIGWYGGHPKDIPNVKWAFDQNKPVIISEFGAGALAGLHGDRETRWTEEYAEYLYEQTILMMKKMPELQGVTPWILADFRSPKRVLPYIQDGWNRKGLISNTGEKKKAFFVMQKWYAEIEGNKK